MTESEITILMNPGIQLFLFFLFNSRTKCQSNKLNHQDLYLWRLQNVRKIDTQLLDAG